MSTSAVLTTEDDDVDWTNDELDAYATTHQQNTLFSLENIIYKVQTANNLFNVV